MVAPTRRQELAALRRVGRDALTRFGVGSASLRVLRHEHNSTFRVDAGPQRFVLRINRTGVHGPETIASEVAWLRALTEETALGVPDPVPTPDGAPLVLVPSADHRPARPAVLLRWQEGRIVNRRLTPDHLRRVARLQSALRDHAVGWVRPVGFVRPRVDALTGPGKVASIAHGPERGPYPADADVAAALDLAALVPEAVPIVADAIDAARATTAALAAEPEGSGLLHADLHAENVLFRGTQANAIDFDDCGWGPFLYDLAVSLWELEERRGYPALRDALVDEHARHHALPAGWEHHLRALFVLRRVQILMWILESRDHVAFRDDWEEWATEDVDAIAMALRRLG